jgi:hypothetical protein
MIFYSCEINTSDGRPKPADDPRAQMQKLHPYMMQDRFCDNIL